VGLQLRGELGDLLGGGALVAAGLDGVVPCPEVAEQAVGLLLGLGLVELVLPLLEGLLAGLDRLFGASLHLVHEPH
jgi:hypothetical protein